MHYTIITGTSSGIGLALAEELSSRDQTLLCISRRDTPELREYARMRGSQLLYYRFDLAGTERIEGLAVLLPSNFVVFRDVSQDGSSIIQRLTRIGASGLTCDL